MEALEEHTTQNYQGMIAVIQPQGSWVTKYNGLGRTGLVSGCYAVSVKSALDFAKRL